MRGFFSFHTQGSEELDCRDVTVFANDWGRDLCTGASRTQSCWGGGAIATDRKIAPSALVTFDLCGILGGGILILLELSWCDGGLEEGFIVLQQKELESCGSWGKKFYTLKRWKDSRSWKAACDVSFGMWDKNHTSKSFDVDRRDKVIVRRATWDLMTIESLLIHQRRNDTQKSFLCVPIRRLL